MQVPVVKKVPVSNLETACGDARQRPSVCPAAAEICAVTRGAQEGCTLLDDLSQIHRPFAVAEIRGDVVTIDQDGARYPVLIDRITPVL